MKKIYWLLLILLLPLKVLGITLPELYSKNVLLYDPKDDRYLYELGSDEVINIASLTKIMTTITAIENIDDLNKEVEITEDMLKEIPSDASVAGLKVGDKVTMLDLLYASMLPSGADATTALAHTISGSTPQFVELMNQNASKLGLTNTHFVNVTGYDIPNHYSTPKEVLKILLYALNNDLFKEIYETKDYTLTNGLVVSSTINYYNQNNTLDITSILGSKTGYTDDAGLCMASLIKVKDRELILITLGAKRIWGSPYNIMDALTIVDYLNNNYQDVLITSKNDVIKEIPVEDSTIKSYQIKVSDDVYFYTDEFKEDELTIEYDGKEKLSYKDKLGEKIGTVKITYEGEDITKDIILNEKINPSLREFIKNNPIYLIPFGICLILIIFCLFYQKKRKKRRKRK